MAATHWGQPPEGDPDRKEEPAQVTFRFNIGRRIAKANTIRQVRVVQHPARVIVDKKAGNGEWEVDPEDDSTFEFQLSLPDRNEPLDDGLYFVHFETNRGERTTGWFIMSNLSSSTAPDVQSPANEQVFATGQPPVRWSDFQSPEGSKNERRAALIFVTSLDDPNWTLLWYLYDFEPTNFEATIGADPRGNHKLDLDDGRYWFALTDYEQRQFGPIRVRRGSRTARPFSIRSRSM